MRFVDLTMPLWEGMPVSSTFPMDAYFRIDTALTYESHGYWMYSMHLDVEAGTCFMTPAQNAKYRHTVKLAELPLENLVLRPATVLSIPKDAGDRIEALDVQKAISKVDFREGDATIVRTGWGDDGRYLKLKDDYVTKTPYYTREGAKKLTEFMVAKKSTLFLSDTALLGYPSKHFIPEWVNRSPRPKSLPSDEAKAYLKTYTREKMKEDWSTFDEFPVNGITACKCLVNCGKLTRDRIKLIVLPLKIIGVPSSTCRIVAVEE